MKAVPFFSALAAVCLPFLSLGEEGKAGFNDGVNRDDPKFVTASLVVISPGNELFSCVGHAAIRLECPTFKLDYCFSYESERAVSRLPAFFAGRLKMGMFAVKTEEFLADYRKDGRGIRQYRLNLPPKVKQRLWQHMDDLAAQGADLPYDYIVRGCAKSVLDCLRSAAAPLPIVGPKQTRTIREVFWDETHEVFPWNIFFILGIGGTESDAVIEAGTPRELVRFLRSATLAGTPVLAGEPVELLPTKVFYRAPVVTPFLVACVLFALAVAAVALRWRWVCWAFLAAQGLAGCFFVYLVTASHLPNSCWNWLLVPFNPLVPVVAPLVRASLLGRFGKLYALILVGWVAFMLLAPHAKTDPAYIVLAGALAVVHVALISGDGLFKIMRCRNNSVVV